MAFSDFFRRPVEAVADGVRNVLDAISEALQPKSTRPPRPERRQHAAERRAERKKTRTQRAKVPGYAEAERAEAERKRATAERRRQREAEERRPKPRPPSGPQLVEGLSAANVAPENERASFPSLRAAESFVDSLVAAGVPPSLISIAYDARRGYVVYVGPSR